MSDDIQGTRIEQDCDKCNGSGQVWDRGWHVCLSCFGEVKE